MAEAGKVLFVLIDGLGDIPLRSLNFRTPLAAAKTPFFDLLAGMYIIWSVFLMS